jgi:glycosyltransferase involved in cell wall biosynthesis
MRRWLRNMPSQVWRLYPLFMRDLACPQSRQWRVVCPLVSTSGGALAEVVSDAALVVSPGDSDALAQQIRRLFDDQSLRAEYAARGLERVEQHFSWERCAERMEAYYRERIASC